MSNISKIPPTPAAEPSTSERSAAGRSANHLAANHLAAIGRGPIDRDFNHDIDDGINDRAGVIAVAPEIRTAAVSTICRCQALAMHTDRAGKISRPFLSPATARAHRDVAAWMTAAGMSVRTDAAGNLIGRLASPKPDAPVLIIGSHLDTIPDAGKFDGILGVMIGLAVVEILRDAEPLDFDLEVIGFSEEEGVRFSRPYLGSAAIAGSFSPSWLSQIDRDGIKMSDAIEAFGLTPSHIPESVYDPSRVLGFIEPHIEQGPVLRDNDSPLGVVDAIVGQSRAVLRFVGHPGHAGTTPMVGRRDALVAASRWIAAVSDQAKSDDAIRATVGSIKCGPGAGNVIPGRVDISIDIRHRDDQRRAEFRDDLFAQARALAIAEGVRLDIFDRHEQSAVTMDPGLTNRLCSVIARAGHRCESMVSGAGHDAVIMSAMFPTTMLFIRQRDGGISHHPDEDVHVDDVAAAIDAVACMIRSLA